MEQDYLLRESLKDCVYEITPKCIYIHTDSTTFINVVPLKVISQQELLYRYKTILNQHKLNQNLIKIKYTQHIKKQILAVWPQYVEEQRIAKQLYAEMYGLCKQIERRKIHMGFSDDEVLNKLTKVKVEYAKLYWRDSAISKVNDLEQTLIRYLHYCDDAIHNVCCVTMTLHM